MFYSCGPGTREEAAARQTDPAVGSGWEQTGGMCLLLHGWKVSLGCSEPGAPRRGSRWRAEVARELLLEHHAAKPACEAAPGGTGWMKGVRYRMGKEVLDQSGCLLLKATRSCHQL